MQYDTKRNFHKFRNEWHFCKNEHNPGVIPSISSKQAAIETRIMPLVIGRALTLICNSWNSGNESKK